MNSTDDADEGWTFACPDWVERIGRGDVPAVLEGKPYNNNRAAKVLRILGNLRLADVPGQPYMRDACGPWFMDIARAIAGGVDADGIAHIKDVLVLVAKKQSKTSYSGLLMLALMLASPRPRAEFMLVGPTIQIAELAFRQVAGAIYADRELEQVLHVREHIKTIEHRASGCRLSVKSFAMDTATGSRCSAILLDEMHLLTDEYAPRVVGQLKGGQASLPESVFIAISTQSDTPPVGFWRAELNKARQVRDGAITLPGYMPVLFEMPPHIGNDEAKWSDPKNWLYANPNMGRSVTLQWLKSAFEGAKASGRPELLRWCSQHLNLEISGAMVGADNRWAGAYMWEAARHPTMRKLGDLLAMSDLVCCGVDGGGSDDLTSLSVVGRMHDNAGWLVWSRSWCFPIALERRKSIAGLLRDFEAAGDLRIVAPGRDLAEIGEIVRAVYDTEKMWKVGIDAAGIGQDLAAAVEAYGVPRDAVMAMPQGFKLLPAWTSMERRLTEGKLWHCGQACLSWAVGNCMKSDRGLVTKAVAGVGKIDPAVAMANAAMLVLDAPPPLDINAMIG